MNTELPIIVKPSRGRWGLLAFMLTAGFVISVVFALLGWAPWENNWEMFRFYLLLIFNGLMIPFAWRNCIVAPPQMIIDKDGIGGCFIGGGFAGATKIAWDDITGAYLWEMHHYSLIVKTNVGRHLYLEVNNDNGKYIPVNKLWSKVRAFFNAKAQKYIPAAKSSLFGFDITNSELNKKQAEEIVEIIKKHAKGNPPKKQDASKQPPAKSPFAAN